MSERRRKPIQVLLENFVLDCISELNPEQESATKALVTKAFGATTDWRAEVIQQLGLTKEVCGQIAELWKQTQRLAQEKSTEVAADEFAATMVEENFADLIEMLDQD